MKQWFAVHTHAGAESKAKAHLERQGFDVYLPRYSKRRSHARKVEWVPAPLFPRYLFVALDLAVARWRAVHSTIGVHHMVCHGTEPAAVPETLIEAIREREDERGLIAVEQPAPFARGETLRIMSGTFADQFGLFDGLADEDRVIVLLSMLGREISAKLPLNAVQAVA